MCGRALDGRQGGRGREDADGSTEQQQTGREEIPGRGDGKHNEREGMTTARWGRATYSFGVR